MLLALQFDPAARTTLADCPPESAELSEIKGLLAHLCDALQDTGAAHFRVFAFDDRPWPVDIRYDLLVVLEQLPAILSALRASAAGFTLSFYEQGIERDLIFHRQSSNWLTVEYSTRLDWTPARSVENIDAPDLERQLLDLASGFVRAVEILCPKGAALKWFREWVDSLQIPSPRSAADLRQTQTADGQDFRGADLRGADLQQKTLTACRLDGALLENSNWTGATLRMCAFDHATASAARFDGATLEDSTAEGADFSRASLRAAHLTETSFSRANLRGAVLDDVEGDGVEFRGADLRGATLIGARLDEADFRGADLRGANLSRGRFHSADFRGALLDGVDLTGADTSNASFDSAPRAREGEDDPIAILQRLLSSLPPEVRQNFRRAEEVLSGEEPPEDWKPWLEPLAKLTEGNASWEELMAALQSALEKRHDAG
jgi:uncharacterized protein YjbI with pentapeptide repeats